jgi:hypothetical protein
MNFSLEDHDFLSLRPNSHPTSSAILDLLCEIVERLDRIEARLNRIDARPTPSEPPLEISVSEDAHLEARVRLYDPYTSRQTLRWVTSEVEETYNNACAARKNPRPAVKRYLKDENGGKISESATDRVISQARKRGARMPASRGPRPRSTG